MRKAFLPVCLIILLSCGCCCMDYLTKLVDIVLALAPYAVMFVKKEPSNNPDKLYSNFKSPDQIYEELFKNNSSLTRNINDNYKTKKLPLMTSLINQK